MIGEWEIDFSIPNYAHDGIFAIIGPTGAGKSTILDAICLALYGKTPRLTAINKKSNEIMSLQSGECFAEVTFATKSGTFSCHWYQRRARKHPQGDLQDPKHEIVELQESGEGTILESKRSQIGSIIEQKTGMDFKQFTRSMLLAQNNFAAFLQASPGERSPILEQITGTEIYSQISIKVYDKQKEEKDRLISFTSELSSIQLLTTEKETEIKNDLDHKINKEEELSQKMKDINDSLNRLENINKLRKEKQSLTNEFKAILLQFKDTKEERFKLKLANSAAELEADYITIFNTRKELQQYKKSLLDNQNRLPQIQESLINVDKQLQKAQNRLSTAKTQLKSEQYLIKQVRDLDTRISEKKDHQNIIKEELKRIEKKLTAIKEEQSQYQNSLDSVKNDSLIYQEYLKNHKQDVQLITELGSIGEKINQLKSLNEEYSQQEVSYNSLQDKFREDDKILESHQSILSKHQSQVEDINKLIESKNAESDSVLDCKTLFELRTKKDSLLQELAYCNKVKSLNVHRASLQEGRPCPLCGSKDHPYIDTLSLPQIDKTETKITKLNNLINKVEIIHKNIEELKQKQDIIEKEVAKADKTVTSYKIKKREANNHLKLIKSNLERCLEKINELSRLLVVYLTPFGVKIIDNNQLNNIYSILENKLNKWLKINEKTILGEKKCNNLSLMIQKNDVIIETYEKSLTDRNKYLTSLNEELEILIKDRINIYGTKNTEEEEVRHEAIINESEKHLEKIRLNRDFIKDNLNDIKIRIRALTTAIKEKDHTLQELKTKFLSHCEAVGFSNETDFLTARLSLKDRKELTRFLKDIDDKLADINSRRKDCLRRLKNETDRGLVSTPMDVLTDWQAEIAQDLKIFREDIGAYKQQLIDNSRGKIRFHDKLKQLEFQKQEFGKWEKLNLLIGSADGKKFRNFAQGITFEVMVSNANKQLEKMNDRYLLIRDRNNPLELNVLDNYQAGEIRSTKNLSGGESFIISLALALGLSHMASNKVSVDSLFLDEGFGSLDEDSLETALETLAGLYKEGKTIGIISHVPALKERITTQISVQPISSGKSKLFGPGCKKIS